MGARRSLGKMLRKACLVHNGLGSWKGIVKRANIRIRFRHGFRGLLLIKCRLSANLREVDTPWPKAGYAPLPSSFKSTHKGLAQILAWSYGTFIVPSVAFARQSKRVRSQATHLCYSILFYSFLFYYFIVCSVLFYSNLF